MEIKILRIAHGLARQGAGGKQLADAEKFVCPSFDRSHHSGKVEALRPFIPVFTAIAVRPNLDQVRGILRGDFQQF